MAVFRILATALACLAIFFVSLIVSSRALTDSERASVDRAITILEERGFAYDAFILRNFTVFRGPNNWINSWAGGDAFAKTNFPFQIITIYPDFSTIPVDDVERAGILLHEARHLRGFGEPSAYRYVWENRCKLGWTYDNYYSRTAFVATSYEAKRQNPGMIVSPVFDDPCSN